MLAVALRATFAAKKAVFARFIAATIFLAKVLTLYAFALFVTGLARMVTWIVISI
jgi:hypothetical protein